MQFKYLTRKRSGRLDSVLIAATAVAASVTHSWGQALSQPSFNASNVYNITVPNSSINGGVPASTGSSDNSAAINAYISYVSSLSGGGTVVIPAGNFNSNTISMMSNVNLELASGATLTDATPANTLVTTGGGSNMEISGSGIINGAATTVTGSNKLVNLQGVSTLEVTGVSIENAEQEHLAVENDSNVTINGITINDPGTLAANGNNYLANTDGIDYGGTNFTIENSYISDGDDDIVAKSASSTCANILITNDVIGAGHGISVGGGTADGLSNMTVSNIVFDGTGVGLRLKAEDASGSDSGGGTLHPVVNVHYSNIAMINVADPIIIDSFYDGGNNFPTSPTNNNTAHAVDSTTPMWANIGFSNITVTGASNDGLYYDLDTTPDPNLIGMSFNNVSITGSSAGTMWWGSNINMSGLTMNHTLSSASLTNVSNSGALSITWDNAGSTVLGMNLGDGATWDVVGNENWNTGTTFTAYTNESNVTFNDSNNGHYNVTLNTTVAPLSTTINNSSGTYAISGSGMIAGTGSVTKTGTGTATISTANAYTGGTIINNGTLKVGSANALGATGVFNTSAAPGGTTVNTGGSLDLDGLSLTEPITLNGGTLTNSSAATASVNGGVKGVGYSSSSGIAAGSTITFSSGNASVTPVFGITAASFGGFTGTYAKVTSTTNPPPQAPSVIITPSDGKGSGALAEAIVTGTTLTGVTIVNPGSGYDTAPIITFVGGNGTGGAATGNANNFTIVGMQTTSTGAGYTSTPTATLNNNGGSGTVSLTPVIGSLTLQSTSSIGGSGDINLGLPISGSGGLIKTGSDTLTLSGDNGYGGGTTVNSGELLIQPTGVAASALPTGPLSINAGSVVLADNVTLGSALGSSYVNLTSLSIANGATLDIGNNHIIINYGAGPDPISSIAALIASGYNGGTWTGTGITSSDAAANSGSYGIGYADASDPGNPAGLAAGQIEVMYTLLGDANLDGKVNGADFTIMAANFNQSVTNGWDQGDFNYDGDVNGADFTALASNFNQSASQSAIGAADLSTLNQFAAQNGISLTNVPEPLSAGIMVMAGLGILHRRRRISR